MHPLLRQMAGLEALTLRLSVSNRSTFIEGTHLNREILPYLPHLRTSNFDIFSRVSSLREVLEQQVREIQ